MSRSGLTSRVQGNAGLVRIAPASVSGESRAPRHPVQGGSAESVDAHEGRPARPAPFPVSDRSFDVDGPERRERPALVHTFERSFQRARGRGFRPDVDLLHPVLLSVDTSTAMNATSDLKLLLASRYPLLVVQVHDEPRFAELLQAVSSELRLPVWTWSATHGLSRAGQPRQLGTEDPASALAFVAEIMEPGVFFFADFSTCLQNPVVTRRVKEIAQASRPGQTLVLTGPRPDVPPEVADVALRWTMPPLDRDAIAEVVRRVLDELAASGTVQIEVDPKMVEELTQALA